MAQATQRKLEDNAPDYLVDANGDPYDSYSLAWRYLGVFMDCDLQDEERRRLENGEDDEGGCPRKLLWAAYHDPNYGGESIGEYQFQNWETGKWNTTTCHADKCTRMNCHEERTEFELVGVFVETNGLEEWTEQLFEHQGYCLWGGTEDDDEHNRDDDLDVADQSDYRYMQSQRDSWSNQCQEVEYNEKILYYGIKPLAAGNMTFALYEDAYCTLESEETNLEDYTRDTFLSQGYSEADASQATTTTLDLIDRWNEKLNSFKVCQPCRAYSLDPNMNDQRSRMLGSGDDEELERWGYNCYDIAGYTNSNQCYQFETETSMTMASRLDLERASSQGTMLSVEVGGVTYGPSHPSLAATDMLVLTLIVLICSLGLVASLTLLHELVSWCMRSMWLPSEWKVNLIFIDDSDTDSSSEDTSEEESDSSDDSSTSDDGSDSEKRAEMAKMDGTFVPRGEKAKKKRARTHRFLQRVLRFIPTTRRRKAQRGKSRISERAVIAEELTSADIAKLVAKELNSVRV